MSIVANNIQYSNGNIQTCTLVIDSKAFQIQYQDGSYKVSSSGEASGESNISSSANVGPVASGASGSSTSGSNTSVSNTSGSNTSASSTLENTTQQASETLEEEKTVKVPDGLEKRRVNTRKLSAIFKTGKMKR
jgi:hypothetical protein